MEPASTDFSKFFFKTRSHDTIHTFKNYFVTVFSVFSRKRYPNIPQYPKPIRSHLNQPTMSCLPFPSNPQTNPISSFKLASDSLASLNEDPLTSSQFFVGVESLYHVVYHLVNSIFILKITTTDFRDLNLNLGFNCAFLLAFLSISKFETFFSLWIWSSIRDAHGLHGFFFSPFAFGFSFCFSIESNSSNGVVLYDFGSNAWDVQRKMNWRTEICGSWFGFDFSGSCSSLRAFEFFFFNWQINFFYLMSFIIIIFSCHISFKCANNIHRLPHKHIPLVVNYRD